MKVVHLKVLGNKVYKPVKLSFADTFPAKEALAQPKKFLLATKSCDGRYHFVNSDIQSIIQKKQGLIRRGLIADVIALAPDESHGQRYIIFDPRNGKLAYLLGDVATALKKLAE